MKNIYFILTVLLISIPASYSQNKEKNTKPNVIFIIADDLGYSDIGAYGSSFYDTPNIDKMVGNSVKFTNGYANCPVCSPSRASFQTGKYPVKTGITDWIKGRKSDLGPTVNDRWIVPDTEFQLKLEEKTIAEKLKDDGYKTAFLGKWHLGEEEKYWPENQGYDINIGGWKMGRPNTGKGFNGYFSPYGNPRLSDGPKGEYLPDRLTADAITLLKDNADKPMFLCLSYYLVHGPFQAKEGYINEYNEKREKLGIKPIDEFLTTQPWMETATGDNPKKYKERIKQGYPTYAAMVKSLDENVGKLISYLKDSGTYDNTLLIFVSDNGGLSTGEGCPTSNLPLAKGKGWMNEGGIRVPFIIKPPHYNIGIGINMPVSGVDLFPTILAYTGDTNVNKAIDGINLKPYIEKKKTIKERPIYWHYPHYGNQGGNPASAIRLGDFKLIHDLEIGAYELYNLKDDIGELDNIASKNVKKTNQMKGMLAKWLKANYNKELIANPKWNKKDLIIK